MPLSEQQKELIRKTLRDAYKVVGPTGYRMRDCWHRDAAGNITGTVDVDCLRNGGKAIGQKIAALWGKT